MLEHDVVYVGGGNTRHLLVPWREWGLDRVLREARANGKVLAGRSAGSIRWFAAGVTDSLVPGHLAALPCLGFLPGGTCPHHDGEPERRLDYRRLLLAAGEIGDGDAADDGMALHVVGDRLERVVGSRRDAHAYRVERRGEGVVETPLVPDYLSQGANRGSS